MSKFNEENPDQIKICRSKIKYPNQKKAHFKSLYYKYYFKEEKEFKEYFCRICGSWHITTVKEKDTQE